jgi:IS5 family transposase
MIGEIAMDQAGFFDLPDHLKRLSGAGDPLLELGRIIDFEAFRPVLDAALNYSDGSKGGRPPYDPVTMFKVLILAAQNNVSDERMEFLIRDRLSWLRFLGFALGKPTPDENTIRSFRERLINTDTLQVLFDEFDRQLRQSGYLPMGGQIVDATLVSAPRQRNNDGEKRAIKEGKSAKQIWPDKPTKAAQKDTDARWTVKFSKAKTKEDGTKHATDIAIPTFGYKNHIAIDQRFGFIRSFAVTDAARHDGKVLRRIVTTDNTASDVWADTAYRSKANEAFLEKHGRTSRIHFKKPKGKPMPDHIARGNATKSKIRARVEHVFGEQKSKMGLFIRTIGLKRAEAKITLVNLAYNMKRLIFHERRFATP